ncbi:hypothetical protein PFISCL1PPCAC_18750, partial [Pristionchus fissidentatus]
LQHEREIQRLHSIISRMSKNNSPPSSQYADAKQSDIFDLSLLVNVESVSAHCVAMPLKEGQWREFDLLSLMQNIHITGNPRLMTDSLMSVNLGIFTQIYNSPLDHSHLSASFNPRKNNKNNYGEPLVAVPREYFSVLVDLF